MKHTISSEWKGNLTFEATVGEHKITNDAPLEGGGDNLGPSPKQMLLVALAGCIVCQEQRSFSSTMGTGQVVFRLATVIIGTTIFKKLSFVKGTTAVMIGSILYKASIQTAISLGLPANLLKFITAVLFLAILVIGNRQKSGVKKNA